MVSKEIQKEINNFYKKYGNSKYKKVNGRCIKNKIKCPYTANGNCRGWCLK